MVTIAVPAGAEVHDGFLDTFERTADDVLSFVGQALESSGFTDVLVTGHSLGMSSIVIRCLIPVPLLMHPLL